MLGKIPLIKGFHVIFTKFYDCCTLVPHGPYSVPQIYNRHACEPFCSCKRRFSWISPVFVRTPLKIFQTVIFISLLKKQIILLQTSREGSCVIKLEMLMQAYSYCRDEMKKRPAV